MCQLSMKSVTLEELCETLEKASLESRIDLGSALLVRGKCKVIGDFIAISTTEGTCAIITQ